MNKITVTIFFINEYTGSLLSSWWHNRMPKDDAAEKEKSVDQKETAETNVI